MQKASTWHLPRCAAGCNASCRATACSTPLTVTTSMPACPALSRPSRTARRDGRVRSALACQSCSMKAVLCKAFGPPEHLVVESVDDPVAGPRQLLVDVSAAAVTFPDTLMLEGKYQYSAPPPYVPGGEVAGVVIGVGDGVTGWSVGDRVLGALGATGGYAELCAISATSARRLPETVDFAAAAGMNYAYGTSLYGLEHRAALKAGETMLILGAGGSVGLSAVEIGKI